MIWDLGLFRFGIWDYFDLGFGIADFGLMIGILSILFFDYQLSLNVP
jgi:hypothetical protein